VDLCLHSPICLHFLHKENFTFLIHNPRNHKSLIKFKEIGLIRCVKGRYFFAMNVFSCFDAPIDKTPCIPSGMRSYMETIRWYDFKSCSEWGKPQDTVRENKLSIDKLFVGESGVWAAAVECDVHLS